MPATPPDFSYTSGIIRRHRKSIGSCWRKLNPARQALLVLAYLRKARRSPSWLPGFGVGTTTAWRYVVLRREALVRREAPLTEGGGSPPRWVVAATRQELSAA